MNDIIISFLIQREVQFTITNKLVTERKEPVRMGFANTLYGTRRMAAIAVSKIKPFPLYFFSTYNTYNIKYLQSTTKEITTIQSLKDMINTCCIYTVPYSNGNGLLIF